MQERMAQFVPVTDRRIQMGDFAVISYIGTFADPSGKNFRRRKFTVRWVQTIRLPEFNENLLGAHSRETRSVSR